MQMLTNKNYTNAIRLPPIAKKTPSKKEQKPQSAPESLPLINTPKLNSLKLSTPMNPRHLRSKTPMNFTFVDLNAKYEKQRKTDISQQSKKIINLVGNALKQQVKAEKRRIFRVFLDQGGSLDLLQLK